MGKESDNTALYGGRTRGVKGGNTSSSSIKTCKHCKQKNPYYKEDDCFKINKEKRKEWEKKNDRKWEDRSKQLKDKLEKTDINDNSDGDMFIFFMPVNSLFLSSLNTLVSIIGGVFNVLD